MYTARDGTEYVPTTSAYAIGEVKSTYHRSGNYLDKMHEVLTQISKMDRPLVENTFHGELEDSTTLVDIVRASKNKYLNHLYSFLICIDAGDFDFGGVKDLLTSADPTLLPNMSVLLNKGVILYAGRTGPQGLSFHKYPIEVAHSEYDWCFAESRESAGGSREGTNLALLYGALVEHLANSHLEPPDAYQYTRKLLKFRRSSLMWAREQSE